MGKHGKNIQRNMEYKKLKISLVITVFNEAKKIEELLYSVAAQTRLPDEIIITDAGSTDHTVAIVKRFEQKIDTPIHIIIQKGNRSVGRNTAIKKAQYEWIAITDAGCTLDSKWLQELESCQFESNAQVVAGNQMGAPQNDFQKAVVPYVLVMQDKIDEETYLPATRSVLLNKMVWKKLKGFDESLVVSEDFSFFKTAKENEISFSICKKAIIYWIPRNTLFEFFLMIYAFAKGDQIAQMIRPKVFLLFLRYVAGSIFFYFYFLFQNKNMLAFLVIGFFMYLVWSIKKNKKYVGSAWYFLPLLQITADIAVISGTIHGVLHNIVKKNNA